MIFSDRDQRILAALDADIATARGERVLARIRARWSALQLNLATVVLTATAFGLLAAGVDLDNRGVAVGAVVLLVLGQAPTLIAFRYAGGRPHRRAGAGSPVAHTVDGSA